MSERTPVRFLRSVPPYNRGEIAGLNEKELKRLLEFGAVEIVEVKKQSKGAPNKMATGYSDKSAKAADTKEE